MHDSGHRYPLKASALANCNAVTLSATGLTEHGALGVRRYTPWYEVTGVRWLRHGQAVVQCIGRSPIHLPAGTEHLTELAAEIDRLVAEEMARRDGSRLDPKQVLAWLGVTDGRSGWMQSLHTAREVVAMVLAAAIATYLLAGQWRWIPWSVPIAVLVAAIVIGRDPIGKELRRHALTATGHSLCWRANGQRVEVPWRHIRSWAIGHSRDDPVRRARLRLGTGAGVVETVVIEQDLDGLTETLRRVVRRNRVQYKSAGDEPIPDTALSPARLGAAENDRSLSRIDA